jgi:hypothetical protein
MTFAKTFAAVFLAVILAAGLIFFLRGVASSNKERAETSQFLFKSAIDNEVFNWVHHHAKEDPDRQILQKRLDQITKAQEAGDPVPPHFPDSYDTERAVETPPAPAPTFMITLTAPVPIQTKSGTVTLPIGTKLQFVSQLNDRVHVHYLNSDYFVPLSATDLNRKRSKTAK